MKQIGRVLVSRIFYVQSILFFTILGYLFVTNQVFAQSNRPNVNWPTVNGSIYALAQGADGTTYIGGNFTIITSADGTTTTRNRIAAIDSSGNVTSWDPNANSTVLALAVDGSTVYAGGDFTTIGGQSRSRIAALNTASSTSNATAWNPNSDSTVRAIVVATSTIYVAGDFISIGGNAQRAVAALNIATSTATSWAPTFNVGSGAHALYLSGTTLYIGGTFTVVSGSTRNRIAALDTTVNSFNATSWNPNANGTVRAIVLRGSTIYAGGDFTTIGGQTRNTLAALNTASSTSNATAWNPAPNGTTVNTLALSGTSVYAGGSFSSVGGQTRNRVAALDTTTDTSNATSWNPNANGAALRSILITTSTVYIGGDFTTLGGNSRQGLGAFEIPTVSLSTNTTTISENGGVATITATLTTTSSEAVAVNLGFGGTASYTTNYTYSSSTIPITAGSTTGTITLTGVYDGIYSSNLTILTSINSVSNAVASSTASTLTTTITNINAAVPTTPTSTSDVATSSIKYNWTSGGGPESYYILEQSTNGSDFSFVTTSVPTSTQNYTFSGLSSNTRYWFRVASGGSGLVTSTFITSSPVYTLANTPTSLSTTVDSDTQITLSWSGDATGYYAENTTDSTNSGWQAGTNYAFTGLTCNTSYTFQVKGRNAESTETSFSSTVSATTNSCAASGGGGGSTGSGFGSPPPIIPVPIPTSTSQNPSGGLIFPDDFYFFPWQRPGSDSEINVPPKIYSPVVFTKIPTKILKRNQYLAFTYSFKQNFSSKAEFIRIKREVINPQGKVIITATGYRILKPNQLFSVTPRNRITKSFSSGTYTVRVTIYDKTWKEIRGRGEFEVEVK